MKVIERQTSKNVGIKNLPMDYLVTVSEWLSNTNYDKKILSNFHRFYSCEHYSHASFYKHECFFLDVIKVTKNDAISFEIGKYIGLHKHGPFGYAVKSCEDLYCALNFICKYFMHVNPYITLNTCVSNNNSSMLYFDERFNLNRSRKFIYLLFISAHITLFNKSLTGENVVKSVYLKIPKPELWDKINNLKKIQFHFNSGKNKIEYIENSLHRKMKCPDPILLNIVSNYFDSLNSKNLSDNNIIIRINQILEMHIKKLPSLEYVASELCMSGRTLRRKLKSEKTSYQRILDEFRKKKTIDLLKYSNLHVNEISESMGYSELSNFKRAFKKWTGTSLGNYREKSLLMMYFFLIEINSIFEKHIMMNNVLLHV